MLILRYLRPSRLTQITTADHLAVEVLDITAMDSTVHPTVSAGLHQDMQDHHHHQECTVGMVGRDKTSNVKTWVDTTIGTPKGLDTRSKQCLLVKVRLRYTFPAFHFSFWVFAFTHPSRQRGLRQQSLQDWVGLAKDVIIGIIYSGYLPFLLTFSSACA